jgi:hypothetical protein
MDWKVFFACAAGGHHLAGNAPCQDSGHYTVADGTLIGVVCDGAGSAAEGHRGSDFIARRVPSLISEAIASGRLAKDAGSDPRDGLLQIIESARSELGAIAASRQLELRDFACTLVGCVTSTHGGFFFHIGDGFGIHLRHDGESVLSHPENGEYADETYFVTDDNWKDHLRVTPIGAVRRGCLIGLMTDGASPFAINRMKTGFYRPFIDPVVSFLSNASADHGNRALQNVLESEKTLEITADDKTLLLALAS